MARTKQTARRVVPNTPPAVNNCESAITMVNCVICYDKIRDTILVPCMHVATCQLCTRRIMESESTSNCPICRRHIESAPQIYLSRAELPLVLNNQQA